MNFLRRVFANGLDADLIRLFRMLLPYKGLIALACIFLIGAASMSSLTATLLGKLTDLGFYQEEKWVIFAAPAALIGVSLLFAVSTVMSSILMAKVSQSVLVTLRTELFERMLHWPAEAYQKFSTGTVSSKFVNEANIALSGATNSIIVLVRDIVQVIALLAAHACGVRCCSGAGTHSSCDQPPHAHDRQAFARSIGCHDFARAGVLRRCAHCEGCGYLRL